MVPKFQCLQHDCTEETIEVWNILWFSSRKLVNYTLAVATAMYSRELDSDMSNLHQINHSVSRSSPADIFYHDHGNREEHLIAMHSHMGRMDHDEYYNISEPYISSKRELEFNKTVRLKT